MQGDATDDVLRDVLHTFLLRSARGGVIDNLEIDKETLTAFAGRYVGTDPVTVLIDAFVRGSTTSRAAFVKNVLQHGSCDGGRRDVPPRFTVLLLCLCIVQFEMANQVGNQNIRDGLEARLGFHVEHLEALPDLWRRLRDWLDGRNIDLVLPPKLSEQRKYVGYHQFLVFPTGRDRAAAQRIVRDLPEEHRRHDVRIARSLLEIEKGGDAWRHHHPIWKALWRAGDPTHRDTLMWRTIVAERDRLVRRDRLVVRPSDDWPYRLRRWIVQDGEHRAPHGDDRGLDTRVRNALSKGVVPMRSDVAGFYIDVSDGRTPDAILMRRDCVDGGSSELDWSTVDGGDWSIAHCPPEVIPNARDPNDPVLWRDGIRVGRGLLHRGPFSPTYLSNDDAPPDATLEGNQIPFEVVGLRSWRLNLPSAEGSISLRRRDRPDIRLVARPRAKPHYVGDLLVFEETNAIHDDGDMSGTAPVASPPRSRTGDHSEASPEADFLALSEALYARSLRGLRLGDAIDLVRRLDRPDAPSEWDLVRSFVDAGWYEPTWVVGACAQKLLPRRPVLRLVGESMMLDGPTCEEELDRLRACAQRHEAVLDLRSSGEWCLPVPIVRGSSRAFADIAEEMGLPVNEAETFGPARPVSELRDRSRPKDYDEERRLFGVIRCDHREGKTAPLWKPSRDSEWMHASRTCALIDRAETEGQPSFVWRAGLLRRSTDGATLPASWSRWLRSRTLSNAGPRRLHGRWSYAYPCDRTSAEALATATRAVRITSSDPKWIERTRRPRGRGRGRGRMVVVRGRMASVYD